MLAVIYVIGISVVAAFLFAAINEIEPNRRYASVLKFLIVLSMKFPSLPRSECKGFGIRLRGEYKSNKG